LPTSGVVLHFVVVEDLLLELGCQLPVIAKGRPLLDHLFARCDLDQAPPVVHADEFYRDQGEPDVQEAHLYADVARLVALVYEDVVYLTDLLVVDVVDGVACEAVHEV
jgi:hypothetical protein